MTYDERPDPTSRILVVDDDPGTIRILAQALKPLGTIHFTTQGTEALALAQSVSPDLILLDIEMPDMHGFELCRMIKDVPELTEIPILFVTSHTDQELEVNALRAGAIDFIHKPPHPEIVKARVRNYLTLKLRSDQLQRLTMIDSLTEIPNRRAFDKAIANEWRRTCRNRSALSLMMVDVDHFKIYNDTHGHQAGDVCLRAVASCLKRKVRRPGDMVARYGGEEFSVLLPDCPPNHALELAESIRCEVSELKAPVLSPITLSVGLAVTQPQPPCGRDQLCREDPDAQISDASCETGPVGLIERADAALYRAKREGRNRIVLDRDEPTTPEA